MQVFPEFPNVRSPVTPMPDMAGDMKANLGVGYTLGQLMRGVPQQQAAAEAQQAELMNVLTAGRIAMQPTERLLADQELLRGEQELLNAPVTRELAIAKMLGDPSTVTNALTGPRVPAISPSNTPMDKTMQFAAPGANRTDPFGISGQVPSDTRELNIPGYPGVGVSPSAAKSFELQKRAEEDERWFNRYDYKRANPMPSVSSTKSAELNAVMARLTPERQMQVISTANTFKSRVLDKDATMLAVAKAVESGLSPDQISDEFVRSENPNLVRNPEFMDALNQGSVKLPTNRKMEIATQLDNYLQPGHAQYNPEQAFKLVLNTAESGMDENSKRQLTASNVVINSMAAIRKTIDNLPPNVRTGLFEGGKEKLIQLIRDTGDPNLSELLTMTNMGMVDYIQSKSGLTVTDRERDLFEKIFPDITKSESFNESTMRGIQKAAALNLHSNYSKVFGERQYKALRNKAENNFGYFDAATPFSFGGVGGEKTDKPSNPSTGKRSTISSRKAGSQFRNKKDGKVYRFNGGDPKDSNSYSVVE